MKKSVVLLVALFLQSLSLYAADPLVITNPEVVRGATLAFAFGSVDPQGNVVTEKGICWATSPNPGIEDNTVTAAALSYRCRLDNLPPASRLYIRAYAKTSDEQVYYGENRTFTTIPKGKVTYTVNQPAAEDIDHFNRIKAAAETSVEYYNKLTSISNKHLTFNYNSGVPTADASYSGWIRFGPNASYQQVGTALHEMAHCIGVGTHSSWTGLVLKNGVYVGRRANRVLQLMTGDSKAYIKGDGTHFWPYGINGAHEDDHSEMTYIINTMIVQAMGEDGLPPSGGFATPAETFAAEAGKKYYIKSEATDQGGRDSMFLVAGTDNTLILETMTPAKALADERAAWYFHFDPATQYYFIRNAATGQHLSLNATQAYNGFTLKDSAQTAVDKLRFQLIRNRNEIMTGDDQAWMDLSGFWIINPVSGSSTQCLRSLAQTIYSYNTSLADANSTLRWILLDEEQTAQFDKIIGGQGAFEPDTSLVYTIKPAGQDKRIKAYITNSLYQVDPREDDQGQKWKLQLVEAQEEGNKRYFLYNPGSKKCLTIQKWTGEETSTAQALKNTRMLAKDETNINQQLSLKSVEVDFSAEVPVRYITIENDHPVMLDTILDERPYRLQILTETTQIGNFFDVDGVRDSQRWVLIPDQVQTALPDATTLGVDLFYRDGLLHYRLPENSTLEVFTLTGQLVTKTQSNPGSGELMLEKGIYMVRVRQQQNSEVVKILAH